MTILFIILFLICIIKAYPRWSYKEFYKRCEVNAQHPDFVPNSGIKHIKFNTDIDSLVDKLCGIGIVVFGFLIIYSYIQEIIIK